MIGRASMTTSWARLPRIYPPPGGRPLSVQRGKSNPTQSFLEFRTPPPNFHAPDAIGGDLRASFFSGGSRSNTTPGDGSPLRLLLEARIEVHDSVEDPFG